MSRADRRRPSGSAKTGVRPCRDWLDAQLQCAQRRTPRFAEYPETGRFGLLAEMPPTVDGKPRELRVVGRPGESRDYWLGE
jgi:hypothetical protein